MPQQPPMSHEQFIATLEAGHKRLRLLVQLQIGLLAAGGVAAVSWIAIKYMGGPYWVRGLLTILLVLCAAGCWIANRKALFIQSKFESVRRIFGEPEPAEATGSQLEVNVSQQASVSDAPKIALTIGFSNLSGGDLDALVSEDVAALSPLFHQSKVVAHQEIPVTKVLFVYAHLNEDGTIKGSTPTGVRQLVEATNAEIVVLASPNSTDRIQNAIALPGPKTANIVFTLDRNASGFSQFFRELFEKMRDGKHMLNAWVELAPQHAEANLAHAPETIFIAEAGKLTFPSVKGAAA